MKLVERISSQQTTTTQNAPRTNSLMAPNAAKTRQRDVLADGFQQLKLAVHNRLFETLDVSRLESLEASMASTKVTQAITEILNEEGRLLTEVDRARLVEEIKNELLGLGPLEPLLWDEDVNDILVNGPNRIIVGEVRGAEVFDMLQAMSTGHDGSICTVHANTPRDALQRLEMMMLLSGASIPQRAMRQQIASALNFVVHVSRLSDGSRKCMKISELTGMEGDMVMMQDLFEFKRTGIGQGGKVLGQFKHTGIRSMYTERVAAAGYRLDLQPNMRG